ncbi:MAG TPA: UDP-3-O-acyl-N-acetylglucosamine deacetylase [Alphaproteobacteria bacterium]|nr:UDP-3-O-acyl-N-acetylglucosamine deacetylase [Alphaproteobacteria bacterium]
MASPAIRQKTIKTAISCTGAGLHSGVKVTMTLQPAPAGTGIVFRRTDLLRMTRGRPTAADIKADYRHVVDTRLCTMLGNAAGATVGTVEHLMAALYGAEIDNLVIEINGPEAPVMDGSAAPFLFLIDCAGVVEQDAPRRAIEILQRVTVDDGKRRLEFLPGAGFAIDFEIDFESTAIRRQSCFVPLSSESFRAEVARARTFGFLHEVKQLRAAGLARGGSLDNAVVVSGDRVLNKEGLRYDDEFVRHKILDCVGDLYLAGAPIVGQINALRSGHKHNNQALHTLFGRRQAWRYIDLTEAHFVAPRPVVSDVGALRPAAGD